MHLVHKICFDHDIFFVFVFFDIYATQIHSANSLIPIISTYRQKRLLSCIQLSHSPIVFINIAEKSAPHFLNKQLPLLFPPALKHHNYMASLAGL